MRMSKLCFLLAGLAVLAAGGMVVADTYQDQRCYGTPSYACPSPCGCPIPGSDHDICKYTLPILSQGMMIRWYCMSWFGETCSDGGIPCGDSGEVKNVYNCPCTKCQMTCGLCDDAGLCAEVTDKLGYCQGSWGCGSQ
jgi:hypothetical protein